MKPSEAYAQHAEAIDPPCVNGTHFRTHWRRKSRLDALHETGCISAATYQAAREYRSAWERIHQITAPHPPTTFRVPGGSHTLADSLTAALDTLTRLRNAETRLGPRPTELCHRCIVQDLPWAETARQLHRDRETVRLWTITALAALERAWNAQCAA